MSDLVDYINKTIMWVFSGVGTFFLDKIFKKKKIKKPVDTNNDTAINEKLNFEEPIVEKTYSQIVGYNHKFLREKIFHFSKREMSEFYNLQSVTQLENYENGIDELPLELIEKLAVFFNLEKKNFEDKNLESPKVKIFKNTHLKEEDILKLLDNDFIPLIVCSPINREELFAYIIMHKKENNFTRIIISYTFGSFVSNDTGKHNITLLIDAMIKKNMSKSYVKIDKINKTELQLIKDGRFYKKNLSGSIDPDCTDIFDEWYSERYDKIKSYGII